MSELTWFIYSNVMVLLFLVTYVMSSLNLTQAATETKLYDLEQRFNTNITQQASVMQNHATQIDKGVTVATAMAPVVSAGNASFLSGINNSASTPPISGSFTQSYSGPGGGGSATLATVDGWLETGGSFNGLWDNLVSFVDALAGNVNDVRTAGINAGIW